MAGKQQLPKIGRLAPGIIEQARRLAELDRQSGVSEAYLPEAVRGARKSGNAAEFFYALPGAEAAIVSDMEDFLKMRPMTDGVTAGKTYGKMGHFFDVKPMLLPEKPLTQRPRADARPRSNTR